MCDVDAAELEEYLAFRWAARAQATATIRAREPAELRREPALSPPATTAT